MAVSKPIIMPNREWKNSTPASVTQNTPAGGTRYDSWSGVQQARDWKGKSTKASDSATLPVFGTPTWHEAIWASMGEYTDGYPNGLMFSWYPVVRQDPPVTFGQKGRLLRKPNAVLLNTYSTWYTYRNWWGLGGRWPDYAKLVKDNGAFLEDNNVGVYSYPSNLSWTVAEPLRFLIDWLPVDEWDLSSKTYPVPAFDANNIIGGRVLIYHWVTGYDGEPNPLDDGEDYGFYYEQPVDGAGDADSPPSWRDDLWDEDVEILANAVARFDRFRLVLKLWFPYAPWLTENIVAYHGMMRSLYESKIAGLAKYGVVCRAFTGLNEDDSVPDPTTSGEVLRDMQEVFEG